MDLPCGFFIYCLNENIKLLRSLWCQCQKITRVNRDHSIKFKQIKLKKFKNK